MGLETNVYFVPSFKLTNDSTDSGSDFHIRPIFTKFKALKEFDNINQFQHITIGKIGTDTNHTFRKLLITRLAKCLHIAVHWKMQVSKMYNIVNQSLSKMIVWKIGT